MTAALREGLLLTLFDFGESGGVSRGFISAVMAFSVARLWNKEGDRIVVSFHASVAISFGNDMRSSMMSLSISSFVVVYLRRNSP